MQYMFCSNVVWEEKSVVQNHGERLQLLLLKDGLKIQPWFIDSFGNRSSNGVCFAGTVCVLLMVFALQDSI
ncbi:unnamed protein product [Arabidopsis halleri]